jgi:hypothetical protein
MKKICTLLIFASLLNAGVLLYQHGSPSATGMNSPTRGPEYWKMDMKIDNASFASFLGEVEEDRAGTRIAGAGDVNGDGIDDILIGTIENDDGGSRAGKTYLIFGRKSNWSMDTDLSKADATFIGESPGDNSGSVAGVGDVNNDGYDDILIGAYQNSEGGSGAGQTYLILGRSSGWTLGMSLSNADASFIGESAGDNSGEVISGAGDVNGDGFDDLIIGAVGNDEAGALSGQTYLVFGRSSGWSMDTDLSDADASFIGEEANDRSGFSVSDTGDINGDGYDDILIGAPQNSEGGTYAGQVYLILGKRTGWGNDTDLSDADASFIGENDRDAVGLVRAGAGDVNGDGFSDILLGSPSNDEGGDSAGQTYLFFGKASGWSMDTDLSNADASFIGENIGDSSGHSVSSGGDVDGDGYEDMIIGAPGNMEGGSAAGQTYMILGRTTGWSKDTVLSNADASFIGEGPGGMSGNPVCAAGNVNGDGYDDLIVSAPLNSESKTRSGQIYIIDGMGDIIFEIDNTPLETTTGDNLTFSIVVSEKLSVSSMYVEYWYGSGSHTNISMTDMGNGTWNHTIVVVSNMITDIVYYYSTPVSGKHWFNTLPKFIKISDNDPPELKNDYTPTSAYTGDNLHFNIEVEDNIRVNYVDVIYWFGDSNTHRGIGLNEEYEGNWKGFLKIPSNSLDTLYYHYQMYDHDYNFNDTPVREIRIYDNDRPKFIDHPRIYPTTGDDITFSINTTDNIGVANVFLEYRYGKGEAQNITLYKGADNEWHADVSIIDTLKSIHYRFHAVDTSDNWARTLNYSREIKDNDPPIFGEDTSGPKATTGDEFTFRIEITDNIEMLRSFVKYWGDHGESRGMTLSGDGVLTANITIPDNTTTLSYTYHAVDTSENAHQTEPRKIEVFDNDPPVIVHHSIQHFCQMGGDMAVSAIVSDNIGLAEVILEYWYGDGDTLGVPLNFNGDQYLGSIRLPAEKTETLYCRIRAWDGSENEVRTDAVEVKVIDSIPPSLEPLEDITTYEGYGIAITLNAADNIGIVKYSWIGSPIEANGDRLVGLVEEAGIYTIIVRIEDDQGNSNQTTFTLTVLSKDHDEDNDGIPDLIERQNGLDLDDRSDASLDLDGDGLTNLEEYRLGTDIDDNDTDDDGFLDGYEVENGFNPLDPSSGEPPSTKDEKDSKSSLWILIIVFVIILLLVIGIFAVIFVMRRSKQEETTDTGSENTTLPPSAPIPLEDQQDGSKTPTQR